MRVLLDSTVLMEGERQRFDLGAWARHHRHEILICDAGVTEYLAGRPVKDAGKEARFLAYWSSFLSVLPSVPLGDGLHGAVADLEGLTVATMDTNHYDDLGIPAFNPLNDPSGKRRA